MKKSEKNRTINLIYSALTDGFKRIEDFEKEGKCGIEHTVLREQLNKWMTLVDVLKWSRPFYPVEFDRIKQLIGEKRKTHSWIGWL